MNALETYQQNLAALAGAREKAGGRITPFEENARLTELDNLWMRLDVQQRQQIVQIWGMEKPHKPELPARPPMSPMVPQNVAMQAPAPAAVVAPAPAPAPAAPPPEPAAPRYTEAQLAEFQKTHRPVLRGGSVICSELQITYSPNPQNASLQDLSMVCDESDLPVVYTTALRCETIRLCRPFLPHEVTGPFTELLIEGGHTINVVGSVEELSTALTHEAEPYVDLLNRIFLSQHSLVSELVAHILREMPHLKQEVLDAVQKHMTETNALKFGSNTEPPASTVGTPATEEHTQAPEPSSKSKKKPES